MEPRTLDRRRPPLDSTSATPRWIDNLRCLRLLIAGVALMALAGCTSDGTVHPLPESSRIPTPDLRGLWEIRVPPADRKPDEPDRYLVIVDGQPRDAQGCQRVRIALLDGNGSAGKDWDTRDPFLDDLRWCAHRTAGLLIIEQQPAADATQPYQHALVDLGTDGLRWCYIDHRLLDLAPESARVPDSGATRLLALPSDALAGFVAEHADELRVHAHSDCGAILTRLMPKPPEPHAP